MSEFELPILHCYRCGNTWIPRSRVIRICPRCKSKLWDVPKLRVPTYGGGQGIEDVLGPFRRRIAELARKYGVQEIRVFGSVARGQARPGSDVDLLVTFDRRRRIRSTLRSIDFGRDLEALLHRRVDVLTEHSLHWFIQPQVLAEAVPL